MCTPLDSKYTDKVIKEYAETMDRLTKEECEAMEIPAPACEVLAETLGYGKGGAVTIEERKRLSEAGASADFIKGLAGTDGNAALKARVRWLAANLHVREETEDSVKELSNIGPSATKAIPELITLLAHKELRWKAAAALAKIGKTAVPDLAKILTEPDLTKLLGLKDDVGARRAAAWALGEIGRDAKAALPSLMKASKDTDEWVCAYATAALRKIGVKGK